MWCCKIKLFITPPHLIRYNYYVSEGKFPTSLKKWEIN